MLFYSEFLPLKILRTRCCTNQITVAVNIRHDLVLLPAVLVTADLYYCLPVTPIRALKYIMRLSFVQGV